MCYGGHQPSNGSPSLVPRIVSNIIVGRSLGALSKVVKVTGDAIVRIIVPRQRPSPLTDLIARLVPGKKKGRAIFFSEQSLPLLLKSLLFLLQ